MFELALELVLLRTIDGRDVHINPAHVVSLTHKVEHQPNKVLSEKVLCVVGLLDGKFISVAEPCDRVQARLRGAQ